MTSRRSAGAFAAGVSRALRSGGLLPLGSGAPYTRQGIRVRANGETWANVSVDLDQPRQAARLADEVAEVLTAAGYTTERNSDTMIRATRKA